MLTADTRIISTLASLEGTVNDVHRFMAGLARPPQSELLSATEVALLTGLSERLVQLLGSSGEGNFPARVKIRRLTKWRRSDVMKWIEDL